MEIVVKDESTKATTYTGTLKGMGEALRTIKTNTGDRVELIGENCGVFYNKDCGNYGIKRRCICHAYGDHWPQVVAPNGGIYTKYKKVAERWARESLEKYGDKIMN